MSQLPVAETDRRQTGGRFVESIATAAVGGVGGWLMGLILGLEWWLASIGGLNGLLSGFFGIYDWRDRRGWSAALLDSTWGLLGTTQALLLHAVNLFVPHSDYLESESYRRNRHVYDRGVRIRGAFALAGGNVISNGGGLVSLLSQSAAADRRRQFVTAHEELHIWQSRLLGPLFQIIYCVWALAGVIVGVVIWPLASGSLRSVIETLAYYNNPFEYWAYRRDGYWPPAGVNDQIAWGARSRRSGRTHRPH